MRGRKRKVKRQLQKELDAITDAVEEEAGLRLETDLSADVLLSLLAIAMGVNPNWDLFYEYVWVVLVLATLAGLVHILMSSFGPVYIRWRRMLRDITRWPERRAS